MWIALLKAIVTTKILGINSSSAFEYLITFLLESM
jgi:hypothetical protein